MYQPNYQITEGILNNIVKLEVDKVIVENADISTKTRNSLSTRAMTLNLFHFAHMLGINLSLKDAEKIIDGKRIQTDDARGSILNNFRNVLEFTRSNISESYVDIDLNIIIHLNKILLTEWKEEWEARLRSGAEEIDPTYDNWITFRDMSIEPLAMQSNVLDLIDWYKSVTGKVHDVLRIGMLVKRFIEISPFIYLNKLTGIAIFDFLMYKNGYVSKSFLPTARHFDVHQDEYIEAWTSELTGDRSKSSTTIWLERLAKNLAFDMKDIKDELNKTIREQENNTKQPFLDLNKRQLKILRYLQTIPTVKREDYVQMMDVSTMTAYRDLNELVSKKLLKIDGQGRGTKYMLSHR